MKKLLVFICSIIFTTACIAQTGTGWAPLNSKVNHKDSVYVTKDIKFHVPIRIEGLTSGVATLKAPAAAGSAVITLPGVTSTIIASTDTATMLTPYVNRSDTASMLTNYINRNDTAGMLVPYIQRTDTAAMLLPYSKDTDVALKLTKTDTTAMLLPYILASEAVNLADSSNIPAPNSYGTGYMMSQKVPYSDADAENVDIAGTFESASVTTGTVTATTATLTDAAVSGEFDAVVNSDDINWVPGTIIDPTNYITSFIVDVTANAPTAGDSIYTDPRIANYNLKVWREGLRQWQNTTGVPNGIPGFRFDPATGESIFCPVFVTNDEIIIEASNTVLWQALTPAAAPYHSFYQTVYDGYTSKPSEAVANACNAWITALDTIDYWSGGTSVLDRCDLILVPAIDVNSANEALMWWNDPTKYAVNVSATEWTPSLGYTGNGTADYIWSSFNSSTDAVHSSQNSMTVGIYLLTNQQETPANVFGAYNLGTTDRFSLVPRNTSNEFTARTNTVTTTTMTGSNAVGNGLFLLTRSASNACALYRNGAVIGTDTDVSSGIPDSDMNILRCANHAVYSTNTFSLFIIFDKIYHADEAAAINTVTEIFADEIGFGVQ